MPCIFHLDYLGRIHGPVMPSSPLLAVDLVAVSPAREPTVAALAAPEGTQDWVINYVHTKVQLV
jgi:hypothetical protein